MAYLHLLSDLGMNYTLNRPLFDGEAKPQRHNLAGADGEAGQQDKVPAPVARITRKITFLHLTTRGSLLGQVSGDYGQKYLPERCEVPYRPVYPISVAPTYVDPTFYGTTTAATQEPIPHPSGGKPVPPMNAAGIQLLLPDRFADVWFNGQKTSSTGTERYYVTPELSEESHQYDVKVRWRRDGRTKTEERSITVHPGKTTVVSFTSKQEARNAARPSEGGFPGGNALTVMRCKIPSLATKGE
jgi:uncharacterized protein (TIGR03000 family)